MVKYPRKNMYSPWKRSKDYIFDDYEELGQDCLGLICCNSAQSNKRAKTKFFYLFFLCLASCTLVLAPMVLYSSSSFSLLYSFGFDKAGPGYETGKYGVLCSSVPNGTLCCDRNSIRSDICVMRGDVRTHSTSSSITLYTFNGLSSGSVYGNGLATDVIQHEKIRPYTRKWETSVMNTIHELDLVVKPDSGIHHHCDVHHKVPAVFFSTGGYTGNLYHEFNDGILPLYITSHHLNKKVVFVILEYHDWWFSKYGDIITQLSHFPVIDFSQDKMVHCFPEAIVGLRIHDELTIDASLMVKNKTIVDFHGLLDRAYRPRIKSIIEDEERESRMSMEKLLNTTTSVPFREKRNLNQPKLVIVSRNGSRAITNEDLLVKMAADIGFNVEVLSPDRTTELAKIYHVLNSSDVMIGVHGAAMTHFLFMNPGSVFIQVIPLGTDWAADTYYGEPARKFGLRYMDYKILPIESSLHDDYDKDDPVLIDPASIASKGWEYTKKIYLDHQTVRLNLGRFRKHLFRAYRYTRKQQRKDGYLHTVS